MNARLLALLAVLGSGPLVMAIGWPLVADRVRVADLTLAVRIQPHHEVVVTGYLKNDKAEPFSLESLLIEEPGKEQYRRLISLDANHRFELALGQPVAGTYRVAAWSRKATWRSGQQEGWLQVPELLVQTGSMEPQQRRVQDYDYPQLLVLASLIVAAQAIGLIIWYRTAPRVQLSAAAEINPV